MPQLALTLDLDGLDAESVEQACFDAGALSVSYTDQRDDPILEPAPGEFRLWPASRLQALFDAADASPELLHHLCANLGIDAARVKVAHLPDRAWEREWLKDFRPMRFGRRLWICPSHEQVEEAGAIVVKLDPGLAFGTGTHPTTRLCLEWLESQLRRDATLIDYGCGSGVLAIAALKLGARRAAGGGRPFGWPLLKQAVSQSTGMPVAVLAPPPSGDGQGEDDQQRAVVVNGQPLILEAYGRDLFFAAPDALEQVQRLSAAPAGPLRDALLQTLFRAADPAKGFRPDQAFHQFYLAHTGEIGVPIGPDHLLPGGQISCQHYALDTLIWTGRLTRLSDLTRNMYQGDPHTPQERELRTLVLNDLYTARTGRNFDPNALFCKYALAHGMGAPMGKAEMQTLEGQRLVAMPYALDVLYCQIPADGDWSRIVIGQLPVTLADGEAQLAQLSELLKQGDPDADGAAVLDARDARDVLPRRVFRGGLLGREAATPPIADVSASIGAGAGRGDTPIARLSIAPAAGPAAAELAAAAGPRFDYYVDLSGVIYRLVAEGRAASAADTIAIGLEPCGSARPAEQQRALDWLRADLRARYPAAAEALEPA